MIIPLLALSLGLISCSDMLEKVRSIVFPSAWGITDDAALGTLEKARTHLEASGFKDGGAADSGLNFIEHGTVHFFVPANDNDLTNIVVIADGDKVLAIRSSFVVNPPTMAHGMIMDLWVELSGSAPELKITRGASGNNRAVWTGRFSTDTVEGKWVSVGQIATNAFIVTKEYANYL